MAPVEYEDQVMQQLSSAREWLTAQQISDLTHISPDLIRGTLKRLFERGELLSWCVPGSKTRCYTIPTMEDYEYSDDMAEFVGHIATEVDELKKSLENHELETVKLTRATAFHIIKEFRKELRQFKDDLIAHVPDPETSRAAIIYAMRAMRSDIQESGPALRDLIKSELQLRNGVTHVDLARELHMTMKAILGALQDLYRSGDAERVVSDGEIFWYARENYAS